jgi:putative membrane protein insertion efficiency factor
MSQHSSLGLISRLMLGLIRAYQLSLSLLLGRRCRYLPTCSDYTAEAIRQHGPWPGFWLGLARIQRCRPMGGDGFDPVPEHLDPAARWFVPWRYGVWRFSPSDARSNTSGHPHRHD